MLFSIICYALLYIIIGVIISFILLKNAILGIDETYEYVMISMLFIFCVVFFPIAITVFIIGFVLYWIGKLLEKCAECIEYFDIDDIKEFFINIKTKLNRKFIK